MTIEPEISGQELHDIKIAEATMDQLLDDILVSGLIIAARKGFGKTVAAKHIVRAYIKRRVDVKVNIFDTCLNWRHEFDKIPYVKMNTIIDSIPSVPHLIVDVPFSNPDDARLAISTIAMKDYDQMSQFKENTPILPYWNIYIIEEIQNIFGSYALNGYEGKFWLKIVSEGRNFAMNYIGIGQRLADISTKVVERAKGYLLGQLIGANCLKKVTTIAGKQVSCAVKTLKQGEFLHYAGDTLHKINFPMFDPIGEPYPYENGEHSKRIRVEDLSWMLRK